jgi:hypothetical protein
VTVNYYLSIKGNKCYNVIEVVRQFGVVNIAGRKRKQTKYYCAICFNVYNWMYYFNICTDRNIGCWLMDYTSVG